MTDGIFTETLDWLAFTVPASWIAPPKRRDEMRKKCVMLAALATMVAPGVASADWLFTPNIGAGFGGSASGR